MWNVRCVAPNHKWGPLGPNDIAHPLAHSAYLLRTSEASELIAHPSYIRSDKSSFFLLPLFSFFLAQTAGPSGRPSRSRHIKSPVSPKGAARKDSCAGKNTPYGGIFGISFRKNTPYEQKIQQFGPRKTRISPKYHQISKKWAIYCSFRLIFDDVWPAKMRRIRLISQKKDLFSAQNERKTQDFGYNLSKKRQFGPKKIDA